MNTGLLIGLFLLSNLLTGFLCFFGGSFWTFARRRRQDQEDNRRKEELLKKIVGQLAGENEEDEYLTSDEAIDKLEGMKARAIKEDQFEAIGKIDKEIEKIRKHQREHEGKN